MRPLILAALAGLLASTPALAWDFRESDEGDGIMVSAWEDAENGYQLAVECDDVFTEPDLYVFTSEPWQDSTSYADNVPLTVTVDGVPTGPLKGSYENIDGEVAVSVYAEDDERVWPLYEALQHSTERIEVAFFDKTASFGVDAVGEDIGKAVERCNQLGGN